MQVAREWRSPLLCLTLAGCSTHAAIGGADGGVDVPSHQQPGDCGLANPAFCETFEQPAPGGRGGDLDEARWSFARWGHQVQYLWERAPASTYPDGHLFPATFCGKPFSGILPDDDVKICDGIGVGGEHSLQLNEVFDDQGDFGINTMRIRQPFEFADRTGKVVWDVDGKVNPLNLGHGWWFEMWITADPVPLPYHQAPGVTSYPRQGVGFAFQFGADCPEDTTWWSALETVHVTDNYQIIHDTPFWELDQAPARCFKVADGKLNHFELRISRDKAELWASDYDDPSTLSRRATAPNLGLTFTRGYVHFQHGQYNAPKDGHVTGSQTFRWDNIGFDGPTLATPRAYDVGNPGMPGAGGAVRIGWFLDGGPQTFTVHDVDLTRATSASFNFTIDGMPSQTIEYSFNGHTVHSFTYPRTVGEPGGVHGFSLEAPLAELVPGDNAILVRVPSPFTKQGIGNLDLTIEASP